MFCDIEYSEYHQGLELALIGAPGLKSWHGAMTSQSLRNYSKSTIIPRVTDPPADSVYFGYTVTSAKIGKSTVFITGVPRANHLLGKVVMYEDAKEYKTFTGNEIGSYFGASIVSLDVNNDNLQDLFIGAPTGKGSTYDEGYVYVYGKYIFYINKKSNNFDHANGLGNTAKLYGSRKTGARFGTSIAALGDIDLDSYNDIAVSAPFENDGLGAVYIYMGTQRGIETTFAQRLSPEHFSGNFANVRGFGLGLSRGNDIDENGHNDLAIGAYKSGQVFIMRTKNVIDYKISLESNVTTLKTSEAISFSVKYCIHYSQRSKYGNLRNLLFEMTLSLDHRVKGERIHVRTIRADPGKIACQSLNFLTQPSLAIITPFGMSLSVKVPDNVFGKGENRISSQIPFAHGCGDDNICQTDILLSSIPEQSNFVLGRDQQIDVNVRAENRREPGSLCELYMKVPDGVALRDKIGCNSDNNTYLVCNFATNLAKLKESKLHFDVLSISPTTEKIEIGFEIKCAGDNLGPGAATATVGITIQNSPHIEGTSDPTDVYYKDDDKDGIEMSHTYLVSNTGPSPVKLDVYLLLPMVKENGKDIFEFVEAKGLLSGVDFYCFPTNQTKKYEKIYDVKSLLSQPLNRTVIVDCFQEDSDCLEILCQGEYLYKTEVAKFEVKVRTNTQLLESHFHQDLLKKDVVAYVVSSFLFNSTRIESETATLIISSQRSKSIALWVWILAALLGIIVLASLIFILYKCHFFDRRYKEKMNDEKLMEQEMDEDLPTLNEAEETSDEPEH
ncbi:hypothetical protein JTB14_004271 [Gonioctena quinquepunctata]|nr:hypothetical protein JTB14_004271 [Gonioctena quinquepunctata]